MEFILLDLLRQQQQQQQQQQPNRMEPATPTDVGHLYRGGMHPRQWIEREQRNAAASIQNGSSGNGQQQQQQEGGGQQQQQQQRGGSRGGRSTRERGNEAFKQNRNGAALHLYTQAIEENPNDELAYSNRSALYFRLTNYDAAVADAHRCIQINPNYHKGHMRLANALVAMAKYEEAAPAFQRAIALAPTNSEKEELGRLLAKCESKRVRGQINNQSSPPLQPPGTPKKAPTSPTMSTATPDSMDRTSSFAEALAPSSPLMEFQPPPAHVPSHHKSAFEDSVQLATGSIETAQEGSAALATLLAERTKLNEHVPHAPTIHALRTIHSQSRRERFRSLLARCDLDAIQAVQHEYDTQLEVIREAVQRNDRERFNAATEQRKQIVDRLSKAVSDATKAVKRIKEMADEDSRCVSQVTNCCGSEARGLPPIELARQRTTSLVFDPNSDEKDASTLQDEQQPNSALGQQTLDELYAAVNQLNERLAAPRARTDAALQEFLAAWKDEQAVLNENSEAVEKIQQLSEKTRKSSVIKIEPLISSSRLEQLGSFESKLRRIAADQQVSELTGHEGLELIEREAELEKERLAVEKQRINQTAELEWLQVKEDDDERKMTRLKKSIAQLKDRRHQIIKEQEDLQKRVMELIQGDHPELQWRAAAGGNRIIKWVKGSGLWVNHSLADFEIVRTLSATPNSKIYHARTRRGNECALKEVLVQTDNLRRRFQNEVNVANGASAHPGVIKILGVFFDGPFAYIMMPYMARGSLREYFGKANAPPAISPPPESPAAAASPYSIPNSPEALQATAVAAPSFSRASPRICRPQPFSEWKMQELFRQVLSAVAHLHEHGIAHADLKPSNILLDDRGAPLLADFGVARDLGRDVDATWTGGGLVGTPDFMAPELLSPETTPDGAIATPSRPTSRTDMWSLGMTLYWIAAQNACLRDPENVSPPSLPILQPGAERISLNPAAVGGSERLADLLSTLLVRDPERRPTALFVLTHPYFTTSLVQDMMDNNTLVQSNRKLEALQAFIHAVRHGHQERIIMSVVRNQMVESVSSIFNQLESSALFNPLFVVFRGEEGIDEGGLTADMLASYFQQCVTKHKLLVRAAGDEDSDPVEAGRSQQESVSVTSQYIPSGDSAIPSSMFKTLGTVLLKTLIEGRPLPFHLNTSVFKFFLGVNPNLTDMDEYDTAATRNLKRLLFMDADDLASMDLDFSEFLPNTLTSLFGTPSAPNRGLTPNEVIVGSTKVTADNVKDYVQCTVFNELISKRLAALEEMKKGFLSSDILRPHLQILSCTELQMVLCGHLHIDPQDVVRSLEFAEFQVSSETPQWLSELIMGFSQNNLRRFLRLCTANVTMPHGGLRKKIKILRTGDPSRLPVGHTCSFQLDLPDYPSKEELSAKLAIALAHVTDGFHVV